MPRVIAVRVARDGLKFRKEDSIELKTLSAGVCQYLDPGLFEFDLLAHLRITALLRAQVDLNRVDNLFLQAIIETDGLIDTLQKGSDDQSGIDILVLANVADSLMEFRKCQQERPIP